VETIVKATCPTCGDVELAPNELELRLCSAPAASTYVFTCPKCEKIIAKSASDGRVVTLLGTVGVPTVHWDLPAELSERRDGPPLTLDDLIDLRLALDSPDWAQLLGVA
jgi:predicted RNA-binding Zn-ribbon protein involved in translation (DUF1610 family)